MAEVVPEDVVAPAPPVAGRPHVLEPLDEEAAGDVADALLARAGPGHQPLALAAEAHRVAEAVDLPAPLARGHDALGPLQAHRDRNLDQRVLAGLERADRLLLVL